MIILKKHFEGKNTTVFMYKGVKVITNGCQCFPESKLDSVCDYFEVSEQQKSDVLNALSSVEETTFTSLQRIVEKYPLEMIKIFRDDQQVCLVAVNEKGLNLEHVKKQTPELCLAAVKQDGLALEYVKEQTFEICLAAVNQNGGALLYVKDQTPETCLVAVKQNGYALECVRDKDIAHSLLELISHEK